LARAGLTGRLPAGRAVHLAGLPALIVGGEQRVDGVNAGHGIGPELSEEVNSILSDVPSANAGAERSSRTRLPMGER